MEAEGQQDDQGLHVLTKAGDTPLASLPPQIFVIEMGGSACAYYPPLGKFWFCYGVGMDLHLVAVQ